MALSNFQRTIVDDAGNVIPNATVTVRVNDSSGALADLFTDRAGTSPASNPISADGEGFVRFYVAGGRYYIKAEGASAEIEWEDYLIGTMQGQDSDSVAVTGGTVNATTLQQGGSQAYVRDNILGTVSQSAGVPTGAVIESGSNVNGVFTKYANGTVVAFQFYQNTWGGFQSDHTVEFIGFNEWPEQTPLLVSGGPTNAAPVSFVGEPYSNVVGGRYADSGNRWVIADSLFDQDITRYVLRKSSSGLTTSTAVRFRRIYIGRWF